MPRDYIIEIIDDAMKKKDRYVTLYFSSDGGVSVSVYPLTDDETELEKELASEAAAHE